jgi:hypothetical protein
LFEDQAGLLPDVDEYNYTPNAEVTLAEGTWMATVKAFLSGGLQPAAVGEATVSVTYGTFGVVVPITLRPVDTSGSYSGNGTFSWDISFPAITNTVTLEITQPDGTPIRTLFLKTPDVDGTLSPEGDRSEGSIVLPAGSYYAQTTLVSSGAKARRRDALFILEGMTTFADAAAGYVFTNDNFGKTLYVTSAADSGPGSLRQVIADAADDDVIQATLPPGSVIALESQLLIDKSLTIEGNGTTITGGMAPGAESLLSVDRAGITVAIRRIRFKDVMATVSGSVFRINNGALVLESCIFLNNASPAIYIFSGSGGSLTALGCTFYNNGNSTAGSSLAYIYNGTMRLGGNLFYGNSSGNLVSGMTGRTATSLGYNVYDNAGGSISFLDTDTQISLNPLSRVSFRPLSSSGVLGKVNTLAIGDYPAADFYGDPIPASAAAAGAAQIPASDTDRSLQIAVQGSGTLTPGEASPGHLYPDGTSLVLTAEAAPGWYLAHWTVNGVKQEGNSGLVTLNEDKDVLAVFGRELEAADEAALRSALNDQRDYDRITLAAAATIPINSELPMITKSMVIEGNGATLVRRSSVGNLLRIDNAFAQIVIRRLRFEGASLLATGTALSMSAGALAVESCVFSGNQLSNPGAPAIIASSGYLTALGCTFYRNKSTYTYASGGDGAISVGQQVTVQLGGNLFYGNTAPSGMMVSVYKFNESSTSLGYNVSDYSGGSSETYKEITFVSTDRLDTAGVSSLSFKPGLGNYALGAIDVSVFNSANPGLPYPAQDFYGNPIPLNAANAGGVQGGGTGYVLNVTVQGPGQVTGIPFDSEGFVASGASFNLSASPATGSDTFVSLAIDGTPQGGNTYAVADMNKSLKVLAVFGGIFPVANDAEFLQALADPNCSGISLSNDITLTARVNITRSFVIEGNGAAVTSGMTTNSNTQFLYINGAGINVVIRRVHFKDGRATNNGAAIYHNNGTLALESCVFSNNQTSAATAYGGAVYSTAASSSLTILGCTFYNNKANGTTTGRGGALYVNSGAVQLGGNLFYGNTATSGGNVVYRNGGNVTSLGYNISDNPIGTGAAESGWSLVTGDERGLSLLLWPAEFKPLSTGAAYQAIATRPPGYPAVDFYGDPIPESSAMSGAVQAAIVSTNYGLDYAALGSGGGVTIKSGSPDSFGFYSGEVILEATGGGLFSHWTVDGITQEAQTPPREITVDMDRHRTVRAVFAVAVTNEGEFLRALADPNCSLISLPANGVITLTARGNITRSVVIEGNGATITQSGMASSSSSQLLYVNGTGINVVIRRVLFKNGRATTIGAAIRNQIGALTLESCIFLDNQTSAATSNGGAVASINASNSLTILGCTFYNNKVDGSTTGLGGVIYVAGGTVRLGGNLFYKNTASSGDNVVYRNGGTVTSLGYNVSDFEDGTDPATGSGFDFAATDRQDAAGVSPVSFRPASGSGALGAVDVSAFNSANPTLSYPTQDFYGNAIAGTAVAGAAQTPGTGYSFNVIVQGPGQVTGRPALNAEGLVAPGVSFALYASPATANDFLVSFTVNGQAQAGNFFVVANMNESLEVLVEFGTTVATEAEFLQALANPNYGIIGLPTNGVITMTARGNITRSVVIEGNGATITSGMAASDASQLLYINGTNINVVIRRVHFKDGLSTNYGAAIRHYNGGTLALESCIFSGNQTSAATYAYGGAVHISDSTSVATISGCTFYGNRVIGGTFSSGGAVYCNQPLILTGNLFWDNTAGTRNSDVYASLFSGGGYNVTDKVLGTGDTESGFNLANDKRLTVPTQDPLDMLDEAHPYKPAAASLSDINIVDTSAIQSYPMFDFYGTARSGTVPAGAVMNY